MADKVVLASLIRKMPHIPLSSEDKRGFTLVSLVGVFVKK